MKMSEEQEVFFKPPCCDLYIYCRLIELKVFKLHLFFLRSLKMFLSL